MAFDSLRYARRLKTAGVPEPQAEAQAEAMAEAFGFSAHNIVTRNHLDATLRAQLGELELRHEQRFSRIGRTLEVNTALLGLVAIAVVVPFIQAALA